MINYILKKLGIISECCSAKLDVYEDEDIMSISKPYMYCTKCGKKVSDW